MRYAEQIHRALYWLKITSLLLLMFIVASCQHDVLEQDAPREDVPCMPGSLEDTGLEEFRAFNVDDENIQVFYELCSPIDDAKKQRYEVEYELTVAYPIDSISVVVSARNGDDLVEFYSDKVLLDGSTFGDVLLRPGYNDLTVYLTDNNNNTGLYNLRVKREYPEDSPAKVETIMDDAFNNVCDTPDRLFIGVNGAASMANNEVTWIGAAGLNGHAFGSGLNFIPFNFSEKESIMTTEHVSGTGSISKTFMSALVLRMIEDGYTDLQGNALSLDTLLVSGLNLTKSEGYYRGESFIEIDKELEISTLIGDEDISLRQLLSHRSSLMDPVDLTGLEELTVLPSWESFRLIISSHRALAKHYNTTTKAIKFDENENPHIYFFYANLNYQLIGILLAEILAKTDGETVSQALNRYFFKPFNLSSTYFDQNKAYRGDNLVRGHIFGIRILYFLDNLIVQIPNFAASLVSSPEDLVRWAEALWGRTGVSENDEEWQKLIVTQGSEVLSVQSLSSMLEDTYSVYDDSDWGHYGLGVMLGEPDDPYLGHFGINVISNATVQYDRMKGKAAAVQLNNVLTVSQIDDISMDILCALDKDCEPSSCHASTEAVEDPGENILPALTEDPEAIRQLMEQYGVSADTTH